MGGNQRYILDYLVEEVLERQSQSLRVLFANLILGQMWCYSVKQL